MASQDLLSSVLDQSGILPEVEVVDLTDSPEPSLHEYSLQPDMEEVKIDESKEKENVKKKFKTIKEWLSKESIFKNESKTQSLPDIEILETRSADIYSKNNSNFPAFVQEEQVLQPLPLSISNYPKTDSMSNLSQVPKQMPFGISNYPKTDSKFNFSQLPKQMPLSVLAKINKRRFKKGKKQRSYKIPTFPRTGEIAQPYSQDFSRLNPLSLPHMNARSLSNLYSNNSELFMSLNNHLTNPSLNANLWNNELNNFLSTTGIPSAMQNVMDKISVPENDEQEEDEELGHAETYADYMPSKLKIGIKHPDPVVETSSLSSVPPPDVWYKLSIPEEVMDNGQLSALQLEAITYACQQHDKFLPDGTRAGFLIGDGAGVGKGRTLAGIIYENYLLGRKRAIWLSVSNDLKYDSERDLRDIGAKKIEVYALNKFKYAKISSKANGSVRKGIIFATYASLIGETQSGTKYNSRLKQLLHWCGEDFDGCVVFDECHKAKNLCPVGKRKPTKTGLKVLELQNLLPKARIVYASATGASEPKNMAYMTRLGLWGKGTPFEEFNDFISVVEKRGVGAMELVAMDMKLRGLYIARQLSFSGVTFKVEEIPLSEEFINMYNKSTDLWVEAREKFSEAADLIGADGKMKKTMWSQFWGSHQRFFKYLCIASKVSRVIELTREAIKNGKCVVIGLQSTGEARTLEQLEEQGELTDFVSTAKGVFQALIDKHFPAPNQDRMMKVLSLAGSSFAKSSNKISGSISLIPKKISNSRKSHRKATQKTKLYKEIESSDDSSSEDKDSDFKPDVIELSPENKDFSNESDSNNDFNPFACGSDSDEPWAGKIIKGQGQKRKQFSKQLSKAKRFEKLSPPKYASEKASELQLDLLNKLEELSSVLPPNTLDQLIDDLGGPDEVAEMTGRKGRVVNNDGAVKYESRSENDVSLEVLNLTEKKRFMDGEKQIAIISEAASSGISLQSDRRVKNQARRVHMTLELPWSADRAIQQFGRTHRSNQVNAPEYAFLISDLAGERRFASIVAKRLECLGALTHGDRRATETRDLSMFNFDTKYGHKALEQVMRAVAGHELPLIPPPSDYQGDFFFDVRLALVGVGMMSRNSDEDRPVLDKDYNNISKFFNRILGMHVELQNKLFKYFTDTLNEIIQQEKKIGKYDLGILDLGSGGGTVKRMKCNSFTRAHATGIAKTELNTVVVERGLSWKDAVEKWDELSDRDEGFYLSTQVRNNHRNSILVVLDTSVKAITTKKVKYFRIHRPNMGMLPKPETLDEIKSKYRKSTKLDVEQHWKENYNASKTECSHLYWFNKCRSRILGVSCEVGLRQRTYYVLSGSVLAVWPKIESVLLEFTASRTAKLQVVRLITESGVRIVGCLIPNYAVELLINVLSEDANDVTADEFK